MRSFCHIGGAKVVIIFGLAKLFEKSGIQYSNPEKSIKNIANTHRL